MPKILLILLLCPLAAFADGGAVIGRHETPQLTATVFAFPSPLRAGPADISVFLQRPDSNDPVLSAKVEVSWLASTTATTTQAKWMPPCCTMENAQPWQTATTGNSKNKFLYSTMIPIKMSGPSQLAVRIQYQRKSQEFTVGIDALPPYSPVTAYWPWLAFPPCAIGLFALRTHLANKPRRAVAA